MNLGDNQNVFVEKRAAEYIGMSRSFLRQSRMDGERTNRTPGPPWIQVGRSIRYLRTDLDEWLLSHRVVSKPGICPKTLSESGLVNEF